MNVKSTYQKLLTHRTVLVLGAGASAPFGFPTGPMLMRNMKGWIKASASQSRLSRLGHSNKDIRDFFDSLTLSQRFQTIDHFLEDKPNFRIIGSQVIALNLMPIESDSALFGTGDWYRDLFYGIGLDSENCAPTENLSIVTFNYDRSLEHYLSRNIHIESPDKMVARAQERVQKIKIVHVHGDLGEYEHPNYGGLSDDDNAVKQAANRIRLISDSIDESANFKHAQDLVGAADRLVFLGFGYNERSLVPLLSKANPAAQKAYGTAFELDDATTEKTKNIVGRQMLVGAKPDQCLNFLRGLHTHLD